MIQPDDLDALLASLLVAPATASEPEPEAEVKPAPVVVTATLPLPELPADAAAVLAALRAWLDAGAPGGTWQAPELSSPTHMTEPLDPETLLELAAARAWQAGDQEGFDKALARLPADRAAHHRRMAAVCERSRLRSEVQRLSRNQDRL